MTTSRRFGKDDRESFSTSSTVAGATTFGDHQCKKHSIGGRHSETPRPLEMDRKDSGFAETHEEIQRQMQHEQPHPGTSEGLTLSSSLTPALKQSNPTDIEGQDSTRHPPTRSQSHTLSSHCRPHDDRYSASTSSRRTSSRRSSTSKPLNNTPRPSLLLSASSFHRQQLNHNKIRPAISLRTTSAPMIRGHASDPLAIHYNSCRLFQSPGPPIAYEQSLYVAASTLNLTSSRIRSSRPNSETAYDDITPISNLLHNTTDDEAGLPYKSMSNEHMPATIIDWTSPSTRRREYQKIDRSCRGFRGWWRRIAPRWCSSTSRSRFYDENDGSDAGSVRRYRIGLPDDEYEDAEKGYVSEGQGDEKAAIFGGCPKVLELFQLW
ncbi:MAG: hypothetical protein M1830_001140 [Pleopsidium flavum]|nr:MAG: hypothetical protein M1830_001140 [Pleopsidium flavum]